MVNRIYLHQYDAWFSLTVREFAALAQHVCESGATEFDLSGYVRLKNRPSTTRRLWRAYRPVSRNHAVYAPLDWEQEDWAEACRELRIVPVGTCSTGTRVRGFEDGEDRIVRRHSASITTLSAVPESRYEDSAWARSTMFVQVVESP